jgi:hypothetical protein
MLITRKKAPFQVLFCGLLQLLPLLALIHPLGLVFKPAIILMREIIQ